jgi:putative endonuclease
MPYFVYILRCKDETLYTGVTNDLSRRMTMHQQGTGAKYTRAHPPLEYVYTKKCRNRSSAQKREAAIKKLTREEKQSLIATGK